jgi:RNA polymerase sigma factor (sigma-70 family)
VTEPPPEGREALSAPADLVNSPESDATIIKASRGDPERFAAIFDRYFSELHRYLARRVGGEAADDLAAEVFLAAFSQRQRYDAARDCARPWLYGIATNLVGAHRRQEARYLRALARADRQPRWQGEEERVADRISASAALPALTAALTALAPGDRDVLLLVALADLGYPEVAQALGIPYGTVCSRLNRARRQLRASLGGSNPASENEK